MSSSRMVAWTVWMIASVFYAYQYILRVMPNIMLEDIMQQFHIGAATFGQFSGVYYIGYSLMHLPIGIMLDRFGPKKVMSGCILLTVVGLLPLIFAEHWAYPIIGRALIGMGSSAAILGVFKIVRMTFSEQRFSRMLSLSVTIGLLGAIYGGAPISYMNEMMGYQAVVQTFVAGGLLLAIATYFIVPEMPAEKQHSVGQNVKEVLMNPRVIWTCILAGMMVGPLEGFADVWGTAFLKQAYGLEPSVAASLPSMIFIGMCFGAPVLSLVAEKSNNYLATIMGSGLVMAISFFFLLFTQMSITAVTVNFIIVGVCCSYQILAIYKASTFVRGEVAGLTTALANMIIMLFGYVFHSIMGGVINALGGPGVSEALVNGIVVIPVALCAASAGFFILHMKEPKKQLQVA